MLATPSTVKRALRSRLAAFAPFNRTDSEAVMSLLSESWTLCNEVLARATGHGDRSGRLSGSGSLLWPLPAVSASVVLRVA